MAAQPAHKELLLGLGARARVLRSMFVLLYFRCCLALRAIDTTGSGVRMRMRESLSGGGILVPLTTPPLCVQQPKRWDAWIRKHKEGGKRGCVLGDVCMDLCVIRAKCE